MYEEEEIVKSDLGGPLKNLKTLAFTNIDESCVEMLYFILRVFTPKNLGTLSLSAKTG